MPADNPVSDTSRVRSIEPDRTWPEIVEIRMHWRLPSGRMKTTSEQITAGEFFGSNGAPMSGDRLVQTIERLRKDGPPPEPFRHPKRVGKDLTKKR